MRTTHCHAFFNTNDVPDYRSETDLEVGLKTSISFDLSGSKTAPGNLYGVFLERERGGFY